MKIVVYFPSMNPAGGIERVISKHIEFLASHNDVVLITNDDKPSFYRLPNSVKHDTLKLNITLNMNSRVKRVFQVASAFFRITSRLRTKIAEHKPDVIYVATPLSVLQVSLAQFSSKGVLVTEHSSYSAYNSIYKQIAGILYKRVNLLTVPTKDDSRLYHSLGIENIYLPNPLSFFPETPSSLESKIVLNVGRLTDDKRHELLINLWNRSKGKNNGWKLHIIGRGENEEKIKRLIAELKLEESIILLPNTKEIIEKFCDASIFVLTSRAEGFGLVLAEAMACGVPCLSFNCPSGPKDIVTNGKNGYLIDEGDNGAFVDKLDDLMADSLLRKELGNQARLDVKQFDEDIINIRFNQLVNKHFSPNQKLHDFY